MSVKGWAIAGIAARVLGVLESVQGLGAQLMGAIEERLLALRAGVRDEVRHAVTALAMSLVAAACALAALGFLATAIMLAVGDEHRVLAALLLAGAFALLALWAGLSARAHTSVPPPTDQR